MTNYTFTITLPFILIGEVRNTIAEIQDSIKYNIDNQDYRITFNCEHTKTTIFLYFKDIFKAADVHYIITELDRFYMSDITVVE